MDSSKASTVASLDRSLVRDNSDGSSDDLLKNPNRPFFSFRPLEGASAPSVFIREEDAKEAESAKSELLRFDFLRVFLVSSTGFDTGAVAATDTASSEGDSYRSALPEDLLGSGLSFLRGFLGSGSETVDWISPSYSLLP